MILSFYPAGISIGRFLIIDNCYFHQWLNYAKHSKNALKMFEIRVILDSPKQSSLDVQTTVCDLLLPLGYMTNCTLETVHHMTIWATFCQKPRINQVGKIQPGHFVINLKVTVDLIQTLFIMSLSLCLYYSWYHNTVVLLNKSINYLATSVTIKVLIKIIVVSMVYWSSFTIRFTIKFSSSSNETSKPCHYFMLFDHKKKKIWSKTKPFYFPSK